MGFLLTHYQTTNLDSSKLRQFADDNFKFDEDGRKLSKRVENTVGKGKIACYEQFLFFPQCFQKACFPGVSKGVIVWEWVKEAKHYGEKEGGYNMISWHRDEGLESHWLLTLY